MISGMQDDTAVDGHVDRYLDGTIQWTFVSLVFNLAPITETDLMIQVSQYGNVVWMSVAVICNFS
jgi:nitrate reductase NapE component